MNVLIGALIFVNLLNLAIGQEKRNVCPTFKDYHTIKDNPKCWYDAAAELKLPDVIRTNGYPFEEHRVLTKDGYILSLFRIPNKNRPNAKKDPIFLQHGIVSSGATFFGIGKDSLGYVLADAGYDVWIANYRGTEYSEGHVNLTVHDLEYWDHSMDELSLYDLPAFFREIEKQTGQSGNIIYIGHSLGPTLSMMYAAALPEDAQKTIKMFIYMAPAYTLSNMISPYKSMAVMMPMMTQMSEQLRSIRLFSQAAPARAMIARLCLESPELMRLCLQMYNQFYGPRTQITPDRIPVYFNQLPAGTSLKVIDHSAALITRGFKKYDFGAIKNLRVYGTGSPPTYDIRKIKIPHYVIYTADDWAVTPRDVRNFYYTLPKEARYGIHEIIGEDFNHEDFVFGHNAKRVAYKRILKVLEDVTTK